MSSKMRSQRRAIEKRAKLVGGTQPARGTIVSEIIGRATTPYSRIPVTWRKTVDQTRPEYEFWSKLARGKEPGYELGGLFAKRIAEVDAEWTLGDGFTIESDTEDLEQLVNTDLIHDNLDTLMTWRKDSSKVGDAYIIVNADGTLSMANPDTAEILTDPLDYTTVLGYRFTTVLDYATIIDEYTENFRTVTFQKAQGLEQFGNRQIIEQKPIQFPNLIGMIPVIHLPNDREANEVYGHPIYEALLLLFGRYDDVLNKSLDGVEVMGRPIPVAEGLKDPQQAMLDNATHSETVMDKDHTEESVPVVDFEDLTMLWLGEGANFKFAAPGSFSADSVAMLKKLFYLMLEHTGIPEWAWGGATPGGIGGNSVLAQMPAFVKYLKGRRTQTQKAVKKLVEVWIAMKRLTTFVPAAASFTIVWPELERMDETLQLNKIKEANVNGDLTQETHLRLLDLVDDPEAEIEAAQEESQTKDAEMQAAIDAQMATMNTGDMMPGQTAGNAVDNGGFKPSPANNPNQAAA